MTFRFRRTLVALTAIVALLVTSLGVGNSVHASTARSHHHATTNVYFILNWLPNVEFAGLWVAERYHWFEKAGIHMGFKGWAPGVVPETDVPNRGGNTFGFQSGAALVIARSKGVPDTALMTDTQKSVFGLTVLSKSKIYKLTDLRGKRVGYQQHELYVPETMLSCAGLTAGRDYQTVPVGFDPSVLTAGQVDAYLTFLTNEPIALRLEGVQTRSFRAADYCFHFYDDVLFTTDSLIRSNPALVKTVTGIVARGFRWAHAHPDLAAKITVNKYFPASAAGAGVSAAKNAQQQKLEAREFSHFSLDRDGRFRGLMTARYWSDSVNILARYHQITKKPAPGSLFTNQFNPFH